MTSTYPPPPPLQEEQENRTQKDDTCSSFGELQRDETPVHTHTQERMTCDGCHGDLPEAQGNFWSNCYGQRQRLSTAAAALMKWKQSCEGQESFEWILTSCQSSALFGA